MCGRYRRTTAEEELARRYHIPIPPQRDLPISWNIAPSQDILAIRFNPETKQRIQWRRNTVHAYKKRPSVRSRNGVAICESTLDSFEH